MNMVHKHVIANLEKFRYYRKRGINPKFLFPGVPVVFFQKSFKDIIVVIYKSIKNNE